MLGAPLALLLAELVYRWVNHDPGGAFIFFVTGVYLIPTSMILRNLWLRAHRERVDVPVAARPVAGPPVDDEPAVHRAFAADAEQPPTRW